MTTILVAYDGSAPGHAVIDAVAVIARESDVIVLTFWQPILDPGGLTGPDGGFLTDDRARDATDHIAAQRIADDGTARARAAGLRARPRVAEARHGIGHGILDTAADVNATTIALGAHGTTRLRAILHDSTARHVLECTDRPVLVVPLDDRATPGG